MTKKRVAVIAGGQSGEYEVSLVSARSVISVLDKRKYTVYPIVITKQGEWFAGVTARALLRGEKVRRLNANDRFALSHEPTFKGGYRGTSRRKIRIDVLFPVLHGPMGEDGTVQGLFELSGIPYVGCGVASSAVNMDKVLEKQLFVDAGFPVTPFMVLHDYHWRDRPAKVQALVRRHLGFPCFVKPARMGSSVGVRKVHAATELASAIREALRFDTKLILEKAVRGAREIEVAVLGNTHPYVSPPGEIISSNEFYDYDAKYVDGKSKERIPARLTAKQKREIQELAREAFILTNCRGLARADFFVTKKTMYINELNTMPGFTSISMYPKLCAYAGLEYPKLLDLLIRFAFSENRAQQRRRTSYLPKKSWHTA